VTQADGEQASVEMSDPGTELKELGRRSLPRREVILESTRPVGSLNLSCQKTALMKKSAEPVVGANLANALLSSQSEDTSDFSFCLYVFELKSSKSRVMSVHFFPGPQSLTFSKRAYAVPSVRVLTARQSVPEYVRRLCESIVVPDVNLIRKMSVLVDPPGPEISYGIARAM